LPASTLSEVSEVPRARYVIDPAWPRAPSQTVWNGLSAEERRRVLDELPVELPEHLLPPPAGDEHYEATRDARETLRSYFERAAMPVYVSGEMAVYYPDELPFQPDVLAVRDVSLHPRDSWVVSAEGRGLDWVLEVLVRGDRRKDLEHNVLRYARLGIMEYFVFEPRARRLWGYRLGAPGVGMYQSLAPGEDGALRSRVLGLDLVLRPDGKLRFRHGDHELLVPQEVIERLEAFSEEATARAEEALRLLEEEQEHTRAAIHQAAVAQLRAEGETQARAEAERRAMEEAQARAEAERRAMEETQARAEAERRAMEETQARAEAERRAMEEAQARAEAERRAMEEAQARAEAERRAMEEAQARAEAERRAMEEAQARAEAERRLRALEARLRALEAPGGTAERDDDGTKPGRPTR
jgi:Uma2 family endonuclease